MIKEILNTDFNSDDGLILFHDQLNKFAKHHHNRGGQKAMKMIKEFKTEKNEEVRDAPQTSSDDAFLRGFNLAASQILTVLHREFVP